MDKYFRNLKRKIALKNYVNKYVEGVQFLMKNGDGVNLKAISAKIITKNESQEFKVKIARYLDAKDVNGFSSLMFAATNEDLDIAILSIKEKMDINRKDCNGYTALMYACRFNSGAGLVKMLLDNNADVNITTQDGKTAMDFAKYNNNVDIINLLYGKDEGTYVESQFNNKLARILPPL